MFDNNNNWRIENVNFTIKQLYNSGYFNFIDDLLCYLSGITIDQNLFVTNSAI